MGSGTATGTGSGTRRCSRTGASAGPVLRTAGLTTGTTPPPRSTAPGWLQNTVRVATLPFGSLTRVRCR
ncbi:hypothetical protein AMK23_27500 [Streptomyces sp. CB02130]|nr:hypothetical protein AMK23_27500 [Streptomyces sp. CB02130]